jgi:hypothetical protein
MIHLPITGVFVHLKEAWILADEDLALKEQLFEAALILYDNLTERDKVKANEIFFNLISE